MSATHHGNLPRGGKSQSVEWWTPHEFWRQLDAEFGFEWDLAATAENAKCKQFYTILDDALRQSWKGTCWLNPPYGREFGGLGAWIEKAYLEASAGNATVVVLVPAYTDRGWFHQYCNVDGVEVRFIQGRLRFAGPQSISCAPYPSMVVIFRCGLRP